jgi:hypothetical protein
MIRTSLLLILLASLSSVAYADDKATETALALEAGPTSVTAKAGVWVHDKTGYVKARDSENGFVCVVDHRIPTAVEPQCMDAEGVKTFFPKYQLVASLRAKGKPEPEIRKAVKAAFANGTLKAPARPGVIYMLSSHNVVTVDEEKGIAAPFVGGSRIGRNAGLAAVRRRREDPARVDDRRRPDGPRRRARSRALTSPDCDEGCNASG